VKNVLTKRLEILVDPKDYETLRQMAKARKTTVGAVAREAIHQQCVGPELERRKAAVKALLSMEPVDIGAWEDVKDLFTQEMARQVEAD